MAISICCPDCDARLTLRAAPAAGARVKCPKCSTHFAYTDSSDTQPSPRKKSAITAEPPVRQRPRDEDGESVRRRRRSATRSDEPDDEDEERRPSKKKVKAGSNTGLIIGLAVGAGLLVLSIVTLVFVMRDKPGDGPQQAQGNPLPQPKNGPPVAVQPGNNPEGNAGKPNNPGAIAPVGAQPPRKLTPAELFGDQGGEQVAAADAGLPSTLMRARRDDTFFKLSNPREGQVKGPDAKGKGNNVVRDAMLIDYVVVHRGKFDGGTLIIHTEDGNRTEVALNLPANRDQGTIQLVGVSFLLGKRPQLNSKTTFPENAEMYVTRGDDRYRPLPKFKVSNSVVLGVMKLTTLARDWTPEEIERYGKPPPAYLSPNAHPTLGEDVPSLNGWAWKARFVEPDGRLLGLEYHLGEWNKEKRIGGLVPIFSLDQPQSKPSREVARPGYAVAGAEVNANKEGYVYAIRLLFRRVKPDGSLDAADAYAGEWIGTPPAGEPKTFANDGRRVMGISYQSGAIVDRFALVVAK
jgi:hypothetical protein